MQLAIELAQLLNLDLLGLFLEDTSLHDLAAFPFARELRPLGGGWHPIDASQLTRDLALAARTAEMAFAEAAKQLPTEWRFEVARGPLASAFTTVSQTNDIVVISAPVSAAERATQQFSWLVDAAFQSTAAVLLVPRRVVRVQGPIVAVAAGVDDPSLVVAADIAAAANEGLVIIDVCAEAIADARIEALGAGKNLKINRIVAGPKAGADTPSLVHALRPFRERLIVLTRRAADGHAASALAAERGVPVLILEPRSG